MNRRGACLIVALVIVATLGLTVSDVNAGKGEVTFTRDVAPILYQKCAECHRPGNIGPMPLLSYKDVRPWAKSIRQQVVSRAMPPWFADPKHGQFVNDPSLTQQQIDTISAWVDSGAPKGEYRDQPALPKFVEGWSIAKPDLVLSMSEEQAIPADGTIPYLHFTIPTNFSEDKWIKSFEIAPSDRRVVHHVVAFISDPGGRRGESPRRGRPADR